MLWESQLTLDLFTVLNVCAPVAGLTFNIKCETGWTLDGCQSCNTVLSIIAPIVECVCMGCRVYSFGIVVSCVCGSWISINERGKTNSETVLCSGRVIPLNTYSLEMDNESAKGAEIVILKIVLTRVSQRARF